MLKIHEPVFCDLGFLDRYNRLCLIGITRRIPVHKLPVGVHVCMLVARIEGPEGHRAKLTLNISSPNGQIFKPGEANAMSMDSEGGYVFVRIHNLPLTLEGRYRFELVSEDGASASVKWTC